jgi:hypothetical protein
MKTGALPPRISKWITGLNDTLKYSGSSDERKQERLLLLMSTYDQRNVLRMAERQFGVSSLGNLEWTTD